MIDIKDSNKEIWKIYRDSMAELERDETDKSNLFGILLSFTYVRPDLNAAFLNELIDALEELHPRVRGLVLVDFEEETVESRLLIDSIWLAEAKLETPNWTRCLEIFDKVIERSISWGYPHLAAAAARGKAIIYDEYLHNQDTAHQVLQNFVLKVKTSPVIEEEQAFVYLHEKKYELALNIYKRILPGWNPPSGQLDVIPIMAHRSAAICAAHLDDWEKAADFFKDGAKRTQNREKIKSHIGFHIDAGFAQFKAGNMLDCINLLYLGLRKFDKLPQDNTDVTYFTLKKRLACSVKWIAEQGDENHISESQEPPIGFCSNLETNAEVLDLPDFPLDYVWIYLTRIEFKFWSGATVLEHVLRTIDRDIDPVLNGSLSVLELQCDFKNEIFDNLPQRIRQLVDVCSSMQEPRQTRKGIKIARKHLATIPDLSNFVSVENITTILISALLIQLSKNKNAHEILAIWRTNSSGLPIKENMFIALNLIESILYGDQRDALTVMKTQDAKVEKILIAALKVVETKEMSPGNTFYAHTLITHYLINNLMWLDPFVTGLAELLSAQWLEKIKFRATLKAPIITVPRIEQACNSSETGLKKIGQILLAAHQAVSIRIAPDILQKFRDWAESKPEQKQEPIRGKNPIAQRLIEAMEKPPHLTDEDVEALNESIKEGKIPIKFDSPFDSDERKNNESVSLGNNNMESVDEG